MHPRVLIVGTVPYNRKKTSRAFDAYFHNWEKENIAQIFSNTKKPPRGHCGTLYQITDQRMVKRWLNPRQKTGLIYNWEDLDAEWADDDLEVGSAAFESLYNMGTRKTPLVYLLRGLLWRKMFWCSKELLNWADAFAPECIFLAFSDDFFIPQIALFMAERYRIPIVSCIGDDYFFRERKTLDPLYHLYVGRYRRLIRRLFKHPGSAMYISDKIRDKYNSEFGLDGQTVYLTSEVSRRPFKPIDPAHPSVAYFGNISLGRNQSLCDIGDALQEISPDYKVDVYSNETLPAYTDVFKQHPGVAFHGAVSYSEVQQKMTDSDLLIVTESFDPANIEIVRYSLSTKAADCLASGVNLLTYGDPDCGVIDYMQSTNASLVVTRKADLRDKIAAFIQNPQAQKACYDRAIQMTEAHHTLARSTAVSEGVISHAISKAKGEKTC